VGTRCSTPASAELLKQYTYAFAHRKTSSVKRLQQATYADLRSQFGLPSETGLQRPTSGGCYLQGTVDQSQEERRSPAFGLHQTPLQGPGQSASLRFTDAHLLTFRTSGC